MQRQYTKLFLKLAVWLMTEVILNLVGLDDLANYNEFLRFRTHFTLVSASCLPSLTWQGYERNISSLYSKNYTFFI